MYMFIDLYHCQLLPPHGGRRIEIILSYSQRLKQIFSGYFCFFRCRLEGRSPLTYVSRIMVDDLYTWHLTSGSKWWFLQYIFVSGLKLCCFMCKILLLSWDNQLNTMCCVPLLMICQRSNECNTDSCPGYNFVVFLCKPLEIGIGQRNLLYNIVL